jgi:hypothetical protein
VSKARNRPPRLEPRRVETVIEVAPPTGEELLERAKVAGPAAAPGRTELRHFVERIVAGDRHVLGELAPIPNLTMLDGWEAITAIFGSTPDHPTIDAGHTLALARRAARRVREVAATGAPVAFATASPASMLEVHLALSETARVAGGSALERNDIGPVRADGRHPRWLRSLGGVTVVTDGHDLCETRDGAAAREWVFMLARPRLVVADGPFAEVAWEAGIEVVTFAGLDRCALVVAAARGDRCTMVPVRTDRPPVAYRALIDAIVEARSLPVEASGYG